MTNGSQLRLPPSKFQIPSVSSVINGRLVDNPASPLCCGLGTQWDGQKCVLGDSGTVSCDALAIIRDGGCFAQWSYRGGDCCGEGTQTVIKYFRVDFCMPTSNSRSKQVRRTSKDFSTIFELAHIVCIHCIPPWYLEINPPYYDQPNEKINNCSLYTEEIHKKEFFRCGDSNPGILRERQVC
jgi:hypothetical protein